MSELQRKLEQINKNRALTLRAFYEIYVDTGDTYITRGDAYKKSGLSEQDFDIAQDYLHGENLVTYSTMGGMQGSSELTNRGINFFESTLSKNNQQTLVETTKAMESQLSQPDSKSVFIVHGRDSRIRSEMGSFLRALGLQIIEWGDAIQLTGDASPPTWDIVKAGINAAQAVVVLFSGDDEAKLKDSLLSEDDGPNEREYMPQARPNVILEAGLAFALAPKRTLIIEVGRLRPISDITGLNVVRLKNSQEKRNDIANRLRIAGCEVNTTGNDWLRAGNFGD